MDPRGPPAPPLHLQHHHQFHHQPLPGMMMHHHANSGYPTTMAAATNLPNSSNPQMMSPNSSASMLQHQQQHNNNNRFPFNSPVVTTTQSPAPSKPGLETLNSAYCGDDSSGLRPSPSGLGIDSQKKKRGRPRKYSPDGGASNIALGLAPTPISSSVGGTGGGGGDSGGAATSSDKKNRGRPSSSSKLQLDALGNCGVGFTPHVILVNAGEDIASKILAFSKDGPRTVCVLSANGSICNVSLRQPAMSGGVVNYEGRFEIISLSGSFLFSENNGQVRSGGLSVSLAGSDGRVLGGGVAGMLMAATPVQIIVGSFIANGKKAKYMPSVPQSHMLSFSAPPLQATGSTPSEEESSEGSEENGSNNHLDRGMGSYGNSNHPIHNMQMYNPMGWPNSTSKMLQN
ncbi:hypothetical protein Cgig2_028350 [Carnegiea gigantea]|uniref:AT-hook motif nuclear-localized protein n=1 Tax=Carnegiea gigantea TaxID=171969 RepID=A0A9Q1KKB9_9CARY|nr:hypothetical protein Cgig2_028350 [Carnegiea gigantea]